MTRLRPVLGSFAVAALLALLVSGTSDQPSAARQLIVAAHENPPLVDNPPPSSTDTPVPDRSSWRTLTPVPPVPSRPMFTPPTPTPGFRLRLDVSWDSPVEAPQETFTITIEMTDPHATYCDWVLADVSGDIATGRLSRGDSTTVTLEADWSMLPLLRSHELFYVYAVEEDGCAFAQVVEVDLLNSTIAATPTPTLSCGYASFRIVTLPEQSIEYPQDAFTVRIANEGILPCGDLDWWVKEPSIQANALCCSPTSGVLRGARQLGDSVKEDIECSINWAAVTPGQTVDHILALFSYPRVNGKDSASLVRVRLTAPVAFVRSYLPLLTNRRFAQ